MKKLIYSLALIIIPIHVYCQYLPADVPADDVAQIKQSIQNWDVAWEEKDVALALEDYAQKLDWTNAFGDRVQSKQELKALLTTIFSLDFVMSGSNHYGEPEIEFLTDEYALARSTNVRSGQKWPDGSPMDDRIIHHLRLYKKEEGKWMIFNHMISQAHQKERK